MKTCTKCGEVKDLEEFYERSLGRGGRVSACKTCTKKTTNQYRKKNMEKTRSNRREYREKNRDKIREYFRSWSDENRDHVREYHRRWVKENREKQRAYEDKWNERNPGRRAAKNQLRRIRKRGTLTSWDIELSACRREAIVDDPCFYCGSRTSEAYHVDHFFPISKGGDDRWSNLVRACEKCNLSKGASCGTAFKMRK